MHSVWCWYCVMCLGSLVRVACYDLICTHLAQSRHIPETDRSAARACAALWFRVCLPRQSAFVGNAIQHGDAGVRREASRHQEGQAAWCWCFHLADPVIPTPLLLLRCQLGPNQQVITTELQTETGCHTWQTRNPCSETSRLWSSSAIGWSGA